MSVRTPSLIVLLSTVLGLAACASTQVDLGPAPRIAPLCQTPSADLPLRIQWRARWRADQKEPERRAAAAAEGIRQFVARAPCLGTAAIENGPAEGAPDSAPSPAVRTLQIEVLELGPRLRIGLPNLIEGGTEVRLRLRLIDPVRAPATSLTTVHWQHGGPFVVRGVANLSQDLSDALAAALLAPPPIR